MKMRKLIACILSLALILSINGFGNLMTVQAATQAPKLSATSISLKVKAAKKVTLKNKPAGAKVTWTSKDKKIATVKNGKITGKKAGSTKVICKVVYKKNGKKVTKKLTVKVTVSKKNDTPTTSEPTTEPTTQPTTEPSAEPTADPVIEISNLTDEHLSQNGITTRDNGQMRKNLTATQLMEFMGQGWNLGNTLEACGTKEATAGFTVSDFEGFWGNGKTTQTTMDGIHTYGVDSVRIPVAWSNMISEDGNYTIDDSYFNRVEEVMNYALNNEMYVIINIHYDSDWWGQFGDADEAVRAQAWTRYRSFWTQISERYKEYSDRLIFESANEELGDRLNDNWVLQDTNNKTGILTLDEQYETLNQINQEFVNIVRASGGNNTYRQLLIAGYNTDVDMTCDNRFIMPTDTVEENGNTKLSVSVHYYTPSTYCISESATNSWGYSDTWGTNEDIQQMHAQFEKMSKFTDEGYGVIIGEYGVCNASKDGIPQFIKEVMTLGQEYGYVPVMWDTGIWYDRENGIFKYSDVAEVFNEMTGANGIISESAATTGIPDLVVVPEENLQKLFTWEGSWTRTDGGEISGGYELISCDEGLNVQSNVAFWQLWVNADWSTMTTPCIKLYMADDEISQNADIQLAYTTKADGGNWQGQSNPQTGWIEKCMPLNTELLKDYPWLMLSSNKPGTTIVKIEIFDAK